MFNNDVLYIGLDDGNAQHKIASSKLNVTFPTHIERATGRYVSLNDNFLSSSDESIATEYTSRSGDTYHVGEVRQPIPRTDEFPYSEAAQILIQHSLSLFKEHVYDNKFVLCTGMPLRQFYRANGEINGETVKRKIKSMMESFEHIQDKEKMKKLRSNIAGLIVQPEALTALFPYIYTRDDEDQLIRNPKFIGKTIAVVDPGGKTTDIAVFEDGNIDLDRSETVDLGYNQLEKKAQNYLYDLGIKKPSYQQICLLLNESKAMVRGKETDHSEWVSKARKTLANDIFSLVRDTLSNAADIDHIIFIGGTISALKDDIQPLIDEFYADSDSDFCQLPNEPDRLNAQGLEIFAELWYVDSKR